MQETRSAFEQTQACDGGADHRFADGFDHSLAQHIRQTAGVIQTNVVSEEEKAFARGCILFIDGQRLTRDCMTELIADLCPEMTVLGLCAADDQPDVAFARVALVIFNLHDASISEAARLLRLEPRFGSAPVLFISSRAQRSETIEAVECGAMGLVRADARIELLIAAIRLVIAGGSYFPAECLTSLMAQPSATKIIP